MILTFDTDINMSAIDQVMLRATIKELLDKGWELKSFADSEEEVDVSTIEELLREIAGIDDCICIFLVRGENEKGWISFIPYNGIDCIVDYSTSITDFPTHVYHEVSKFF